MKRYLFAITLLLLIACKPEPKINETVNFTLPEKNVTPPVEHYLTLSEVIDEFSVLDADLNTTWKKEQIPGSMIQPSAVEPWTKRLKLIGDLTEKDSLPYKLVQVRFEMLRSQVAYYLGAEIGKKGVVPLKQDNETFTPGLIDCANVEDINKATKLYYVSYNHFLKFTNLMDDILQNSDEAKQKIGTDQNRIAFYVAPFRYSQKKIDAIKAAVEDQCSYVIELEDTK